MLGWVAPVMEMVSPSQLRPAVIQTTYDEHIQLPISVFDETEVTVNGKKMKAKDVVIDGENWTEGLGQPLYSAYLVFFTAEVQRLGAAGVLEQWIFSEEANKEGRNAFSRFIVS